MQALWVLLTIVAVAGLAMTLLADRAVRAVLAARRSRGSGRPGISVLKPVKGLDEGFRENLLSLARQEYPDFEILVGAAEANDPALAVAREVGRRYPHARVRAFVCPEDGGLNPKVSILRRLSTQAHHDLVLVSDSNVRVGPGYLVALAEELGDPRVGLVSNPIAGDGARTLGARLEHLHLPTFVARATLFAHVHGHACVVGKSMLFRLSRLAALGGWAPVRDVLAEDYALGRTFQLAGDRVAISPFVITTYNQDLPVERFFNRHLRWAQMRRRVSPATYLIEPVFYPSAVLLLLLVWALAAGAPTGLAVPASLAGLALRLGADRALLRRFTGRVPSLGDLLLTVPKDVAALTLWAIGVFRRTVDWRGNRLLVGPGSRLERLPARRSEGEGATHAHAR